MNRFRLFLLSVSGLFLLITCSSQTASTATVASSTIPVESSNTEEPPSRSTSEIQQGNPPTSFAPDEVADFVFINGQVLTMDKNLTQVEALAIKDDRILGVGTNAEMLALSTVRTRKIDLQGATLLPGFIDPHTHLLNDSAAYGMTLVEVQEMALANGFTTISNLYTTEDFLRELQALESSGLMRLRVSAYLIYNTNCGDRVGEWYLNHTPQRDPSHMLWINGIKVFADGGSCNRVALSYETSAGSGYGDLYLTSDEFAAVVEHAQRVGYQVAIHALGDRAIETALDGYAKVLTDGLNPMHHRIDHNAILRPDLLPRYGEFDLVALIFGTYPSCTPFGTVSPEPYNSWEWAWPTLLDANPGLHVAWHGDDPYIPPINPVKELYGLVTRNQALDDGTVCDALSWIADDTLSVDVALPMMNREAAYALLREDTVGTLEPGKFADLVLLSANPLSISAEDLPNVEIWATVVGGHTESCHPEHERHCP